VQRGLKIGGPSSSCRAFGDQSRNIEKSIVTSVLVARRQGTAHSRDHRTVHDLLKPCPADYLVRRLAKHAWKFHADGMAVRMSSIGLLWLRSNGAQSCILLQFKYHPHWVTCWRATSESVQFYQILRLLNNCPVDSRLLRRFWELEGRLTYPSNRFCGAVDIILQRNHGLKYPGSWQGSTGWGPKFLNRFKAVSFDAFSYVLAVKCSPNRGPTTGSWANGDRRYFLKRELHLRFLSGTGAAGVVRQRIEFWITNLTTKMRVALFIVE